MTKQYFRLMSAGLSLLVVGTLPAKPVDAAPQLISLVFNAAPQSPQQIGADEFRRKLVDLADNRLAVDERGSATLGSEGAMLAAIRAGILDLATLSGSVVSSAVPEFGVFDVPFLFRDAAQARAVAEGPVGAELATHFGDKGLVLLAIGKQGFRNITNSKRAIKMPADLKGLKIRVLPNEVYQATFKALGAEVVPMDFPLVYPALKDGRIDGQENPIITIAGSHFEEVQKYLSLTGHFFAAIAFIANRETFEALSPDDQAMIRAAAKAGADATWLAGADEEAKRLDQLRKGGMEIVEKPDRQPFIDAVKPLEPEFEKRFGKEVLAAIRSTP